MWTQQFRSQNKPLAEGIPEALTATRRAGFRAVELLAQCFEAETAEVTLKALRDTRLEAPSVYYGGPMHTAADAEKTIAEALRVAAAAKSAGAQLLNFNPSPKPNKERKSDEELAKEVAAFLDEVEDQPKSEVPTWSQVVNAYVEKLYYPR